MLIGRPYVLSAHQIDGEHFFSSSNLPFDRGGLKYRTHSTTMASQTQNVMTNIIMPLKKHPNSWRIQLFAHFLYFCNFLLTFLTFTTFCSLFIFLQLFARFHIFAAFRGSAFTRSQGPKLHIGTPFSAGDVLEDGEYFSCLKISFFSL